MATFTCEKCGSNIDTRCKPKKCTACGESGTMCKAETAAPPKKEKKSMAPLPARNAATASHAAASPR